MFLSFLKLRTFTRDIQTNTFTRHSVASVIHLHIPESSMVFNLGTHNIQSRGYLLNWFYNWGTI
jgi:hypothetical protein